MASRAVMGGRSISVREADQFGEVHLDCCGDFLAGPPVFGEPQPVWVINVARSQQAGRGLRSVRAQPAEVVGLHDEYQRSVGDRLGAELG